MSPFSNACHVLLQCDIRVRLHFHLLYDIEVMWLKTIILVLYTGKAWDFANQTERAQGRVK